MVSLWPGVQIGATFGGQASGAACAMNLDPVQQVVSGCIMRAVGRCQNRASAETMALEYQPAAPKRSAVIDGDPCGFLSAVNTE